MVLCHNCHICRTWRSREVGDDLKPSFWVVTEATRRENVYGKGGFSLYNTAALKLNFIVSITGYCQTFYRILPLSPTLLLFYLFCIH